MAKKLEGAKKRLVARLAKVREESLDDCWEYHAALIKGTDDVSEKEPTTRATLLDIIEGIDYTEWEDVAFYAGLVRGLELAENIIRKARGV